MQYSDLKKSPRRRLAETLFSLWESSDDGSAVKYAAGNALSALTTEFDRPLKSEDMAPIQQCLDEVYVFIMSSPASRGARDAATLLEDCLARNARLPKPGGN